MTFTNERSSHEIIEFILKKKKSRSRLQEIKIIAVG